MRDGNVDGLRVGEREGRVQVEFKVNAAQFGDGLQRGSGLAQSSGNIGRGRMANARAGDGRGFDPCQDEHLGDQLFQALRVIEAPLQPGLVLGWRPSLHGQKLQRRFRNGNGSFQLVGGIADKGTLLFEGSLQTLQNAFQGLGERR